MYNFQRPHSALGGLVPADRFFGAAPEVLKALKARVAANSLELARGGVPKAPFYLAGNAGGQAFSVHAEGERVILKHGEGERQEIDLVVPQSKAPELPEPLCPMGSPADDEGEDGDGDEDVPEPGTSPLDDALEPIFEGEEREVLDDAEAPASWDEVESVGEEDGEELEGGEQP